MTLIAQITDLHIRRPGELALRRVDTAAMLDRAIARLAALDPAPDAVVATGDLVDGGTDAEYAHLRARLAALPLPLFLLPGNHDDRAALRAAFPDHGYLRQDPDFLQFAVTLGDLRLVGLDTVIPERDRGGLCAHRLTWLEGALAADRRPTVIAMHHPPIPTGMPYHDARRLEGREALAAVLRRHPHVAGIMCGHVHRTIAAGWVGVPVTVTASTAHQAALDLRADGALAFALEPPGFRLFRWFDGEGLVSHAALVDAFDGPHPFFADGRLIA